MAALEAVTAAADLAEGAEAREAEVLAEGAEALAEVGLAASGRLCFKIWRQIL